MLRFFTVLACLTCMGCPQPPVPVPVPGPAPAILDASMPDMFYGQIFDCHADIVAAQRTSALGPVGACLASASFMCLAGLVDTYDISTVACVVRDLGVEVAFAVNAGTATDVQKTIAASASQFISSDMFGYK